MQRALVYFFIILLSVSFSGCSGQPERVFWTSYSDLNWENIGHYDSEFHTHPGLGDEQYDPHQTVDRYHEEGYRILVLAGHDYDIPDDYINSIYPWTKLSEIYETIRLVQNPTEDNKTYEEMANGPYQDRDPIALGMVSIEGNEVSGPHHMVSLFNSLTSGAGTEAATLQKIEELGGIVYFAHPGRYVDRWGLTAYWYVDKYLRFDGLIGQAVFNREDSHPGDRAFYDKIVHILGSERPIWLFGEDDMHREDNLGWNRDVILLENFRPGSMHPDIPDGSAPDVYHALKNGHSYLWKPSMQYNKRAFNIVNVEVAGTVARIHVDNEDGVKQVRWKTHDPDLDETVTVHYGYSVSINDLPVNSRFVRAEIEGPDGTIYMQPFFVKSP
jgi:hypothetical protein